MAKNQSYRKPYRIRKKRSILRSRFFWIFILIVILVGTAYYLLFFTPTFKIKEVKISGNQKISTEIIQNVVGDTLRAEGNTIFIINPTKIEHDILGKIPQIGTAIVKMDFLNKTLKVKIQERQPYGLFCKADNNCWYFDKDGIAFELVQNNPLPMIQITDLSSAEDVKLGDRVIDKELLDKIQNLNYKIINDLKINIARFEIPSQGRLNVKTADGWEIYFDPTGDLNWQATELGLVLQKEIPPEKVANLDYIDLRFSKVFYKYQGTGK